MSTAQLPMQPVARLTAVEAAFLAIGLLLFPQTRQAIKAEAERRMRAPESATPRAGTPGAALSTNLEKEDMATVSDSARRAIQQDPAPLTHVGDAQHEALLRWHNRRPVQDVMDDLRTHAHFPKIPGGAA